MADVVYSRITGEGAYFDSRVVFVAETGSKAARRKQLAIMDYDGANVQYLTGSNDIVLAPRFSPTGDRVLYTSYETGFPRIYLMDVGSANRRVLQNSEGTMSFAPRFSPDGNTVVYSLEQGGNTDIYAMSSLTKGRPCWIRCTAWSAHLFEVSARYIDRIKARGTRGALGFSCEHYDPSVWRPRWTLIQKGGRQ